MEGGALDAGRRPRPIALRCRRTLSRFGFVRAYVRTYSPVSVHDGHAQACCGAPHQRRASAQTDVCKVAVGVLHQRQNVSGAVQNTHLKRAQGKQQRW